MLLTGGTGFIGPFLIKSLLEQTQAKIHVLVRSSDEAQGRQRLKAAMESMGPCPAGLMEMFEARVLPVCGDLGQEKLGLTQETWDFLAAEMDSIYHNGATVNYLFNYDRMRDANVLGTNEVLKLAFEGKTKRNYVSTTFNLRLGGEERSVRNRLQQGYGAAGLRIQSVQVGCRASR